MTPTNSLFAAFVCAFTLLAGLQEASGLALVADDRYVRHTTRTEPLPPVTIIRTPGVPFGPFHVQEVATQDSEMQVGTSPASGDVLSGSASGYAIGLLFSMDSTSSDSVFSIRFRIDGPSAGIQLSGLLDGYAPVHVELRDASTSLYYESVAYDDFQPIPTPFAFDATLGPGEYQLLAIANGSVGIPGNAWSGTYQMDFTVTEAVPEPTTALAVALGLAGLGGAARRRGPSA